MPRIRSESVPVWPGDRQVAAQDGAERRRLEPREQVRDLVGGGLIGARETRAVDDLAGRMPKSASIVWLTTVAPAAVVPAPP